MNVEYGEADLVQWAEVIRDWDGPIGVFLVDARCRSTGKVFADGYYPLEIDVRKLEMVHCPHCKDWHWLRIAGDATERRPVRLVRVPAVS